MIAYEFEIHCNEYGTAIKVRADKGNVTDKIIDKLFDIDLTRNDIRYICMSYDDRVFNFLHNLIGYGIVSDYKVQVYKEGSGL